MKKRVFDQEMVKESIRAVRLETDEIKLTAGKKICIFKKVLILENYPWYFAFWSIKAKA